MMDDAQRDALAREILGLVNPYIVKLERYRNALEEIAGIPDAQGEGDLYGIPELARKALEDE